MLRLAVVSLLSSKALAVIDDSSALIQQRRDHLDNAFSKGNICTQKDLDDYAATLATFKKKDQVKKQERAAKAKKKSDAISAAAQEKATAFLKPMLDKVDMVGKYLEVEAHPTGLLVTKALLQALFHGPLVSPEFQVDGEKVVADFLKRWDQELVVHVKSLLKDGFEALHQDVEKAILDLDPVVQAHVSNATYPVHNDTELQAYIAARVLPVTAIKAYPTLEDVAKVLVTMPANTSEQGAWAQKEVLPALAKNLPHTCQPARLLTTLGLGFGDIGARVGKFVEVCKKGLGMEAEEEPPARRCSTCEEVYRKQTSDMKDPNSCMAHCTPVAVSCLQGVTDACLHKFHPCLRCQKRKLAALDTCLGNNTHANMIEMIGKLSTVVKTATVEQSGVNAFMDSFLDVFKVA